MDPTVFIGITVGISLLMHAIGLETGLKLFYHPDSIMIVLGGTLGATIVHFPLSQLMKVGPRLKKIFSVKRMNYVRDVEKMVKIGAKLKKEGPMALNNVLSTIDDHFLKNALQLLIDRVPASELESILRENIQYMKSRHNQGIRFFDQMAKYAPGFGLLGTLIGLIMMLANLSDPKALGPSMSVALVTTFYGVLLSNLIFLPLSGRLRISSTEEIIQKEMILEGVMSIAREESSYLIREKMAMLLPEKERLRLKKNATSSKKGK
jgi:chemotaxis protein MotA